MAKYFAGIAMGVTILGLFLAAARFTASVTEAEVRVSSQTWQVRHYDYTTETLRHAPTGRCYVWYRSGLAETDPSVCGGSK